MDVDPFLPNGAVHFDRIVIMDWSIYHYQGLYVIYTIAIKLSIFHLKKPLRF